MIRYEDHCCDCAVPGYPCLGDSCSLRHVPVLYCDMCGEEIWEDSRRNYDKDYHVCTSCVPDDEDYEDIIAYASASQPYYMAGKLVDDL